MRTFTVCLDLDDTLIPNSFRYNEPTWKCGLIITKALGIHSPYATDLMKIQYEKDMAMVEEYGFDARRFPLSWVQTYEEMCQRYGREPDPKIARKLRRTAERFKFGPFCTFEGVIATLEDLRNAGHYLHLVTAGDLKLQQRKIDQSGVGLLCDEVHIVEKDKSGMLASIAGDRPSQCVMVGDSKRSDITPAVALGMHAVWIPSNTWAYAHAEVDEGAFTVIKSVTELPALLEKMGRPKRRAKRDTHAKKAAAAE